MKVYLNEFEQDQENDQIRFDENSTYLQIWEKKLKNMINWKTFALWEIRNTQHVRLSLNNK